MKLSFTCLAVIVGIVSLAQSKEMEIGTNFIFSVPLGTMKENMRQAGGLNLDFYLTPASGKYAIGFEMSANTYGYKSNPTKLYTQ